jgi:hypothetical protein
LAAYLLHMRKLEKDFEVLDLQHIPRAENAMADDLSTKFSTSALVLDGVLERRMRQPIASATNPSEGSGTSTSKPVVPVVLVPWSPSRVVGVMGDSMHPNAQDTEAHASPNTWIMVIQTCLKDNIIPHDMASADRIVRLAKRYMLVERDL